VRSREEEEDLIVKREKEIDIICKNEKTTEASSITKCL